MVYPSESGQKNPTVIGISTSTDSPPISTSCSNSISGVVFLFLFLNTLNLLQVNSEQKYLLSDCDSSPSTDVMVCLNLVVNSGETSEPIFLDAFNSSFIKTSSLPVNSLKVIFF